MSDPVQLRVYRFGSDAVQLGAIVGVLERSQLRIGSPVLDALFIGRDLGGRLAALDLSTGRGDGTAAAMLDFRLAAERRAALTERTLAAHPRGVPREVIEAVGETLGAGTALIAALIAGPADALDEAAERSGGRIVHDEPTAARTLAEAAPRLLATCTTPTGVRTSWTPDTRGRTIKPTQ
jgi:hypothetical protein